MISFIIFNVYDFSVIYYSLKSAFLHHHQNKIIIIIIISFRLSFSHQYWLMVFHRNLNNSKSFQVPRTLLSILADLRKTAVRMFSILPLISNSSSYFSRLLGIVPCAHQPELVFSSFSCSIAFSVLRQGLSICLSFRFLLLLICGQPER